MSIASRMTPEQRIAWLDDYEERGGVFEPCEYRHLMCSKVEGGACLDEVAGLAAIDEEQS